MVVEAKRNSKDLGNAIGMLKEYLVRMSCPTGLLVSPTELRILENRYEGSAESVREIGPFKFDALFAEVRLFERESKADNPFAFENAVRLWLEELPRIHSKYPADLDLALEQYVLPVLSGGVISAGGPRDLRRAN